METVFVLLLPLLVLSTWAFWSKYPVAFQLTSGVALITGFRWYDAFGTPEALAFSLALILYSFCMAGTAFYTMFASPKGGE